MKFLFKLFKEVSKYPGYQEFRVIIPDDHFPKEIEKEINVDDEIIKQAIESAVNHLSYSIQSMFTNDERFRDYCMKLMMENPEMKKAMEQVLAEQVKQNFRNMVGLR